ncbi:MAG: LysR family transcriptional regulator, partial [Myxococcota bacterium]
MSRWNLDMELNRAMEHFLAAVDAGSLSAAARELGLPRATVSRHIAQLEDYFGAPLLRRTTRSQTLTEAGRIAYVDGRRIVEGLERLRSKVHDLGAEISGTLRVTTPPAFRSPMLQIIRRCREEMPRLQIEVLATAEYVDIVERGFDVAFRGGPQPDSSLKRRKVFTTERRLFASPAYLEERGVPKTPRDLRDHDCLIGTVDGVHVTTAW